MSDELHAGAPQANFNYSKENRQRSTNVEGVLWGYLRNRKLNGYKFRRQHPISDFIADFYCHECKLVIEIDGDYHNDLAQKQYDKGRTYVLEELNIKVLRFNNQEVINTIGFVLEEILIHLANFSNETNSPHPTLS
jgi:very-short-patch-repair endonuclease